VKSAFDVRSLLLIPVSFLAIHCVLWLNIAKVAEEVNRMCHPRNMTV